MFFGNAYSLFKLERKLKSYPSSICKQKSCQRISPTLKFFLMHFLKLNFLPTTGFFQNSNFTSSFNEPSKIFQFEKNLQWFSFAFLLRKCSGQKIIVRKIRGVLSVSKLGLQWPYKEKLKVLRVLTHTLGWFYFLWSGYFWKMHYFYYLWV